MSAYRGVLTVEEEVERANRQVAEQYLRCDWDDDGSLVVHARVPSDVGAQFLEALEEARRALCTDARGEGGPAGPVHRTASATNVDALHLMSETLMASGPKSRQGSDRTQVGVYVDETVLRHDDAGGICELDGGPAIAPETARRLACDSSIVWMVRGADGRVVATSDKHTSITWRARRIVHERDKGCRFPGCGARVFVDVHHVRFRSRHGSNDPDNLIELCWFHHRLVHEGGWKLRLDDAGRVVVTNPAGNVIPAARTPAGVPLGVLDRNSGAGIAVEADTITPRWSGDPLDLGHITAALWCADRRHPDRN